MQEEPSSNHKRLLNDDKYRRLIDQSPEAIAIHSEGKIVFANKAAARLVGAANSAQLIGKTMLEFVEPKFRQVVQERVRQMVGERKDASLLEEKFVRLDGKVIDVEVAAGPFIYEGKPAVQVAFRDITQRKLAEEENRRNYETQAVINALLRLSLENVPLDEILRRSLDLILSVPWLSFERRGAIFLVAETSATLSLQAHRGLPPALLESCANVPFGKCLCGRAAYERELLFVDQVDDRHSTQYSGLSPHGHYCVPILSGDRLLGLVNIYVHAAHSPLPGEKAFLLGVADALAGVIHRKQMERVLRESQRLTSALNTMNAAINSTLDFEKIMKKVVVQAAKAMGCEASAIVLSDNDRWIFKYVYGLPRNIVGKSISADRANCAASAIKNNRIVSSSDAYLDSHFDQELMRELRIRSFLSVPLRIKNKPVGVLDFYFRSKPTVFTEAQCDFASKLAAAVSLALENARLYAAQRNIAYTFQEALLRLPATVRGVRFGYFYRSASEDALVGGDFYDLFELGNDQVGILIGDVSGKGLEAATLAALVKNTVRAYAFLGMSPAAIASQISELVRRSADPSTFVTAFLGILDKESGNLTYCNAGHPPALVRRVAPEVEWLDANSPALGISPELEFSENRLHLKCGDILVLYTDGVIEARNEKELFGEERLAKAITSVGVRSAPDSAQAILDAVSAFSRGALSDDLAILTICRPTRLPRLSAIRPTPNFAVTADR